MIGSWKIQLISSPDPVSDSLTLFYNRDKLDSLASAKANGSYQRSLDSTFRATRENILRSLHAYDSIEINFNSDSTILIENHLGELGNSTTMKWTVDKTGHLKIYDSTNEKGSGQFHYTQFLSKDRLLLTQFDAISMKPIIKYELARKF